MVVDAVDNDMNSKGQVIGERSNNNMATSSTMVNLEPSMPGELDGFSPVKPRSRRKNMTQGTSSTLRGDTKHGKSRKDFEEDFIFAGDIPTRQSR